MKYSVCIDALFGKNYAVEESMKLVKAAGYSAIEFWSWWDKDLTILEKTKEELRLEIAAFCTRFINPGDKELRLQYLQGLKETISVAKQLQCPTVIVQAGWLQESYGKNITDRQHRRNLTDALKAAAEIAEKEDICLALEPLNILVDHPGYHLSSSIDAFELLEKVGSSHVKLLFDIYHQQITEGNIIRNITEHIQNIAHIHVAGNPGRTEITKGELNYAFILEQIRSTGYAGYIGMEYVPQEDVLKGLQEAKALLK